MNPPNSGPLGTDWQTIDAFAIEVDGVITYYKVSDTCNVQIDCNEDTIFFKAECSCKGTVVDVTTSVGSPWPPKLPGPFKGVQ